MEGPASSRRVGVLSTLLSCVALGALSGCASSEGARLADKGDYAGLRRYLDQKGRSLDGGEAREIARAVVRHEVGAAEKPEDAKARLDELVPCVDKVEGTLEQRAERRDDVGAKAAYLLVDHGLVGASRWRKEARSEDVAWRAVGARSLTDRGDGRRRELFLDLDTRVRTGAFAAALDALDPADGEDLLEAVRLDPDLAIRGVAARAAGALGGAAIVDALRDRWDQNPDDGVRASIVTGWGRERSYDAGGRDRLLWVAETTRGAPAITAASLLFRHGGAEASSGRAALARAIEEGPSGQRVTAIHLAPIDDPVLQKAIVAASDSEDGQVKSTALGRISVLPEHKAKALETLGELAARGDADSNHAKHVLVVLGDRRVVGLLVADAKSKEPKVRAWAATELASMKEFPEASIVMTDEDAETRVRAACGVLAMRK